MVARDARPHPSPNSGFPESAVAGALGIRLGGHNVYHGIASFRAYMGEAAADGGRRYCTNDKANVLVSWRFCGPLFLSNHGCVVNRRCAIVVIKEGQEQSDPDSSESEQNGS